MNREATQSTSDRDSFELFFTVKEYIKTYGFHAFSQEMKRHGIVAMKQPTGPDFTVIHGGLK